MTSKTNESMTANSFPTKASPIILNVDDNPSMRYARRRILSGAGYQVIDAATGEEALLFAAAQRPDLVVLDVSLPDVDGIEVCRRVKSDPNTSHIMVLQVSAARTSKMDIAAGLAGGADGYLIEPIDPLELLATVKALLRLANREKENRRLIEQLTRTERQFAEATDAADCGMWDWDIASGKLEWFGAHERLAGMLPGGFNGKVEAFTDILHQDDRARVWSKVHDLIARREEQFADEYRFVHPDGTVHWMTAKARFSYDDTGRAVRMTGVVQDITERKRTEEFLGHITDIAPSILYVYDLEGRRNVWGNREMYAGLGYSREQIDAMAGDLLRTLLHPDDWPSYVDHAERLVQLIDGEVAELEYRMRHADGSYRWLQSRDTVFARSRKGTVKQIVGSALDVTDRKLAEDALLAAHDTFHHLVEQSPFGIYAVDSDFRLVQVSVGAQKVFENVRPLLGRDFSDVLRQIWPEPFASEAIARFRHTLQTGEPYHSSSTVERRQDIDEIESYDWKIERLTLPDGRLGVVCHFYDLSERQRYEQQLAAAKQQLEGTLSATEIGVWHWDLTDNRLTTDRNLKRLFGLEGPEEPPAEAYTQRIHPDDYPRNQDAIEQVVQDGGSYDQQFRVIHPDGTVRWLHSRGKVEVGEKGRRSFVGVVLDITERKEAEEQLQESETRFRTLADNMSQFAWMADEKGWLLWYNQRWFDYTGTTLDEMQGWGWKKVHHDDHLPRVIQTWQRSLETGEAWEDTFPLRGQDGKFRWFLSRAMPIRDADGRIVRWFGTNTDITDLREAEQAQAHLAAIVTSSDDAIISKDLNGIITSWNRGAERLYGYTEQEIVGRSITILMPPERIAELTAILARIEQGESIERYETVRRRKDGTLLDISLTVSPIRNEQGCIVGASKVARDITERNRQQEELRQLKDTLEVRVRERTAELLVTQNRLMALTSQLSLTEQQERRKLARELHDYLAQMLVVGQMKTKILKKQMLTPPANTTLVDELNQVFHQALTYTRTLIAELSPPSLHDAGLPAALQWLGERFLKDGLRVNVQANCASVPLPEDQAVVVFHAVRELLFNVMKHAAVDHARVTVSLNDTVLRVAVADRGKGSTPEALQGSTEPGHLGLVSVRERFSAVGGHIEVDSRPGQGTTVTLVLPLARSTETNVLSPELVQKGNSALSPQLSALQQNAIIRVLLVDDHQLVRQGLKDILANNDRIRVVGEAGSCEEALLLAANVVPDVVVMDVHLPDSHGIDATKRFKKLYPRTMVIGLSFHTDEQVADDMIAAGAETLLFKDHAAEELIPTIVEKYKEQLDVRQATVD